MLLLFIVLAALLGVEAVAPVLGTKCAPNQVKNTMSLLLQLNRIPNQCSISFIDLRIASDYIANTFFISI